MNDLLRDADTLYEMTVDEDGRLLIPPDVLKQAGIISGDVFRISLVDGQLLLAPFRPLVTQIATEISQIMAEEGITASELFDSLAEAQEEIYQETYGHGATNS